MPGRLSALIVGLGAMGSHHLRVLGALPGVRVAAVVEPDDERRAGVSGIHPGVRTYTELERALAEHRLDFACLAVPVRDLPACAEATLGAGIHTFVEKPLAPTEREAEAVIELAADRRRLLMVGHVERFNPAVIALRRKVDEGLIGPIVQMHARRLSPFPNRSGAPGVALDLATHDIDVMRYVAGTEVERVYAESVARLTEGVDDLICATLRFEAGATGLLEANWITPTKVRQLTVLGDRGMFVVDYLTQDLVFYEHPRAPSDWDEFAGLRAGGEGNMIRYALERREPLRVQWEALTAAIQKGGCPPVDGYDGLAALSIGRAIQRSAAAHEIVTPSYREAATV
jgi:UDP-N-acetylglucosamine 3-dehydrogenase